MCGGETVIENCPKISDTYASSRILTHLGLQCIIEKNVMTVRNNGNKTVEIPDDLMREMRSSIIYMGALFRGLRRMQDVFFPAAASLAQDR